MEDSNSLAAQAELLRYYEEKRRREKEDAQLASSFRENANGPSNNFPIYAAHVEEEEDDADMLLALRLQAEEEAAEEKRREDDRKRREEQDIMFARRLQEEEREQMDKQRRAAEQDALMAKQLVEEERRKLEQEKEKKEWESTMNLIRQEAKTEADRELARLLREKEELEEQLEREREAKMSAVEGGNLMVSLADVEYPPDWEHMAGGVRNGIFDVPKRSSEWQKVLRSFSVGMPNSTVHKIERNQNRQLWMWYWLKREEITQKIGYANEQIVFHGSRANAYDIILKTGFDHRVANMGGAIGAGVYFAFSSATSNGYIPGNDRWRKMLVCKVTLGEMGPGKSGLRRPPEKANGVLYDSVGTAGSMCVVFDNYQAYPEYTVYFTG